MSENVSGKRYILALDQGTTSSRAILFDEAAQAVGLAQLPFEQRYPKPGYVEHDAMEIWETQREAMRQCLQSAGVRPDQIEAIGITNQRETTVIWERDTGKPIAPAIVWQCRRTAARCDELVQDGWAEKIRDKTGLVVDAYFSATKAEWMLNRSPELRERAAQGELLFGTVDSWLLFQLSGKRLHVTDVTNASRTMLFNIHTLDWDDELLELFGIPRAMLPDVRPSSALYGETDAAVFGARVPLAGIAGDQQAALFGQGCFQPGMAKNTYGTGCFLLMNTGDRPIASTHGLLTTVGWQIGDEVTYALEGSVFIAGAGVQWLRDELGLIQDAAETETLAYSVPDANGVYLVPAFTGLGAPYWDPYARGTIWGLTRGANRAHIARASLEAIAYQTRDVLDAMEIDSGMALQRLLVDGGAVQNKFLLEFQAGVLGIPVVRPEQFESTARGAAFLAGLSVGFWPNLEHLTKLIGTAATVFAPQMEESQREELYQGWKRAAHLSRGWLQES
ncbi:glycerol kinase GlpK [Tumebacillus flagellatus]|uniref:Glycerol kinase n=1 Tax=Tumebacillus flagellatus TaxID=1157490 RepID=A0A074LUU1_9BACL|nr:glycerol kinase GlpK [Tumebacillus flagellatus]KEO84390.1 glycerol kinase [Tumebacillus flagellatus]